MTYIDPNAILEGGAATVTALGGLYAVIKGLIRVSKNNKAKYRLGILEEAKEEVDRVKRELSAQLKSLEDEFNIQRDFAATERANTKERHALEIKIIGEKISDLKDQFNQQHDQLVALITQLINK